MFLGVQVFIHCHLVPTQSFCRRQVTPKLYTFLNWKRRKKRK